jgi:hypothetical protein
MKRFLIALLTFFIIGNIVQAQEYVRLMEKQNANFYDIQQAFYDHWEGKTYEKGKGWKQFKRWEYFIEPRVYPTGKLINPSLAYEEYIKFKNKYSLPKGSINNKTVNWVPLGPDSWNAIGWNPGIGRINAVTVDPNNSNTIYVGTPAGGCWKSTNGGNSWIPLTDNLSSLGVSGIAIDPTNSNTIYIATGDGDGNDTYSIGVLKSTDGGNTWGSTGLNWLTSQTRVMRKIIIDPLNADVLFVATSNGLWKTTNAGNSWTSVLSGSIRDVEFNPFNSNTVFACTSTQFYKSNSGGNTGSFSTITNGTPNANVGRLSIAVTANDTNYIYLLASNSGDASFLGLYRSIDGGNSFSLRTNSPNVFGWSTSGNDSGGQSWYDMALAVSPTNKNEVFTGGVNLWRSLNGGATLTAISQWNWPTGSYEYVHADIHTIDYFGSTLFSCSDGGIFKSTNSGNTFSDITFGIQHSQFYKLGTSTTNSGIIMAGAQDNGCYLLKNGTWTHVTGADGMECVVDYSNTNNLYSTSQNGTVYKSTNGGNSFNSITSSINGSGAWVTPFTLDPSNPNTIYLGYNEVWKSTNGGSSWSTISSFASNKLKSLVVSPSDNNVIYAANDNIIFKTTNGGSSWTNITSGLPNNAITYISVHNLNPNILWVSLSGFTSGEKVYQSTDGGLTWINVSSNLPNLPINCVVYENGSNNGIYVGTDMGVYYKNDDLAQWQSYMIGLPNVIVNELEIHYGSGKIRAATFGRGIWESDLYVTTLPVAQFFSPDTNICPANCAKFTNTTPNLGLQWKWYFPGGTPSTSTDINPTICYPSIGNYDVSLVVYNPLGSDSIYTANYIKVQTSSVGNPLPLAESFESSSTITNGWNVINDDQGITWDHNNSTGGFGLSSSCVYLDNFSTNFKGERDYLVSPVIDFSTISTAEMTFDVAHSQWSVARSDTLAIYYSTDCGVTKNLLWEKDGSTLATAPYLPIYFNPTPTQWRNDTVNLNVLAGLSSVEIYFENKSDNGNVTYIDNINIHEVFGVGIKENSTKNIVIYPNPFENTFTIKSVNKPIQHIKIYNSIGKLVFAKNNINSTFQVINLNHLANGFYVIRIGSFNETTTHNLVKH